MRTKALILAAGEGTRLRPLTHSTPKAMAPLNGKPLLAYHLDAMKKCGVTEILINTHWLPEPIKDFCARQTDLAINVVFEERLRGSAGTLFDNRDFFADADEVIVIYGDVLTNLNYSALLASHRQGKTLATVVCHRVTNVGEKGMVVSNEEDRILSFVEKPVPEKIVSDFVNGGIYVLDRKLLDYWPRLERRPLDFGHDIFPFMLEQRLPIFAYRLNDEFLLDIGTTETYDQAQRIINKLIF